MENPRSSPQNQHVPSQPKGPQREQAMAIGTEINLSPRTQETIHEITPRELGSPVEVIQPNPNKGEKIHHRCGFQTSTVWDLQYIYSGYLWITLESTSPSHFLRSYIVTWHHRSLTWLPFLLKGTAPCLIP